MFTVIAIFVHTIGSRLSRVEDRLDNSIGAVSEVDKRVTRIELKLGIQP